MWWLKDVWVIDPSQTISFPRDVLVKGDQVLEISSSMTEGKSVV